MTVIDTKNFVLRHYPSLTVQEVEISREHEDGEKRWVITWPMKFEGGDIDPVKPVHVVFRRTWYLVTMRVFFQGSVESLAATRPDMLFIVHMKDSAFTMGRI